MAAAYGEPGGPRRLGPGALGQLFPDAAGATARRGHRRPPRGRGPAPHRRRPASWPRPRPAYNEAQTALQSGDLAAYQKAVDRVAELIRQARAASGGAHHHDDDPAGDHHHDPVSSRGCRNAGRAG